MDTNNIQDFSDEKNLSENNAAENKPHVNENGRNENSFRFRNERAGANSRFDQTPAGDFFSEENISEKERATTRLGYEYGRQPFGGDGAADRETAFPTLSYEERLRTAIKIAEFLSEEYTITPSCIKCAELIKQNFAILKGLEIKYLAAVFNSFDGLDYEKQINILTAFALFYVLSCGKYPQNVWEFTDKKLQSTPFGEIKKTGAELLRKLSAVGETDFSNQASELIKAYQRDIERADIAKLPENEGVGGAKIYEMLWEVFVMKYANYRPKLWLNKLKEFEGKKFNIRRLCEFSQTGKNAEIYAVSYEGKLSKPMHVSCEDFCFVNFYDENTFIAVAADGVGSCRYSSEGSRLAAEILGDTIAEYLEKNDMIARYDGKPKKTDDKSVAGLMYFMRFALAGEFYSAWESAIKCQDEFGEDDDVSQYASTLQFVFGCERLIACGRVGDGTFYVRKRERLSGGYCIGGITLNDGISGVTQSAVFTVAALKNNPSALQVDFFAPSELTDILISSDGVSGALGNMEKTDKFVRSLRELSFADRRKKLSDLAKKCSDYNETQYGSGDDCTVLHICFKDI